MMKSLDGNFYLIIEKIMSAYDQRLVNQEAEKTRDVGKFIDYYLILLDVGMVDSRSTTRPRVGCV